MCSVDHGGAILTFNVKMANEKIYGNDHNRM